MVTGSLTAPMGQGTYTLAVANPMANVIREGETGVPIWATEEAEIGPVTHLTITVDDPTIPTVSEWGLAVMLLIAMAAGTLVFAKRER